MICKANSPGSVIAVSLLALMSAAVLSTTASAQTPVGTEFTFQAQLKQAGIPMNGEVDLKFRLYDAAVGGSQIPPNGEIEVDDRALVNGELQVVLDFGSNVFTGDVRWLEVDVRNGNSTGPFDTMTPRQTLTATPYAQYALNLAGGSQWTTNGAHIFNANSGRVGGGTNTPRSKLDVVTENENISLRVSSTRTAGSFDSSISSGAFFAALEGHSTAETGDAVGVRGTSQSPNGRAVDGWASNGGFGGFFRGRGYFRDFLGVGRTSQVDASEVFGIYGDTSGFAGMYAQTSGQSGQPFYGYSAGGDIDAYHHYDGLNGTWRLVVGGVRMLVERATGNVGIGTAAPDVRLHVDGGTDTEPGSGGYLVLGDIANRNISMDDNEIMARTNGAASTLYLNNAGGDVRIGQNGGSTTVYVPVLAITGADMAENFPVSETVIPGMVVAIDPDNPGQLRLARGVYNRRVAGVVSGAGDLTAGAILGNLPGYENAPPIALSGRVWVYCDATDAAIDLGDLLTTSDTVGYAMKVIDYPRAQGAIIGKAMTPLAGERGLVLVLISLQ